MNQPTCNHLRIPTLFFLFLGILLITLPGCKKDKGDGILSGVITKPSGFLSESSDLTNITEAYCYVFLDNDNDITNGYAVRLIIDLINITPGTTDIDYEFDTSKVPAGKYYLMAAYDFSINNDNNTDPANPPVWEAKGWYGSETSSPPASATVSDLSADYDITLHGLE